MSTLCFEEGFDPEYDKVPLDYIEPLEFDSEAMPEPSMEEMEEYEIRRRERIQRQQEH